MLALDPFGSNGRGGNGGTTTKGFEFRLLDVTILVHLDLELCSSSAWKDGMCETSTESRIEILEFKRSVLLQGA